MAFLRRIVEHACRLLALIAVVSPAWCAVAQIDDNSRAAAAPTEIYVFWRVGCPHCERALAWLTEVEAARPELRVHRLEVGAEKANRELLIEVAGEFGLDRVAVPLIVVGTSPFVGFLDANSTGREIEAAILACRASGCPDLIGPRLRRTASQAPQFNDRPPRTHTTPTSVRLPIIGQVDTAGLSLLALTVVLAAADGFNPCAMWTLVFLLGLIAGMQDRVRMWVLGIAFVAASAAVYFLFMAAWLNVLLVLGMLLWLRIGLGALAIGGGIYALKRGFSAEPPVCEVTAPQGRRKVLDAMKGMALERNFLLALSGIVLIAVAVNVVELICSAGIPAVYTQVLALTEMPRWRHYAYLALYVSVFMLDDVVVLGAALGAVTLAGASAAYTRWSNRVGGIILIGLGLLLIIRPQFLVVG